MTDDYYQNRVLVVDDEANMRHMLATMLSKAGYTADTAADGKQALSNMENNRFQFILCDIKMPKMDGLAFLKQARQKAPETTIIMMSAYGTIDTAIEAMKLGAYDYIAKPFKADEVLLTLKKASERENLKKENTLLKKQLAEMGDDYTYDNIIAKSKPMQAIIELIGKVAVYDTTVLVTGESGTGKELVAKSIHHNSHRSENPLITVNCGGLPENLLESELFGHVKGAFTGADKNKIGICEKAHTGTLFLDEIGELPLSLQVKLLRLLQESEIRPVGASENRTIDIRVIAATAKDLAAEVDRGSFREDLFYRLNVMNIHIPALRQRPEDIPYLSRAFIEKFNRKLGRQVRDLSSAAMTLLINHTWSGNVRELENVIERAVVLAETEQITPAEMPPALRQPAGTHADLNLDDFEGYSLKAAQRIFEKKLIEKALAKTGGNRTQASRLLEISHPSLLTKIKGYQIKE
ncbi:MAG: sigma-54-dependent transcriptional regulator [Desulfosudaceae bacterium]